MGEEEGAVDMNVLCQFPIFDDGKKADDLLNDNILDVTVSNKYGLDGNHQLFMILFSSINHKDCHSELYAMYIDVRDAKIRIIKKTKLASSQCLTKFLVGRGCYQTVRNDWMCTLIGVDEHNLEVRHQLRLNEELELLYWQRVQRNESVQEVTGRYECNALKYFEEAKEEEIEMRRVNQVPRTANAVWQ